MLSAAFNGNLEILTTQERFMQGIQPLLWKYLPPVALPPPTYRGKNYPLVLASARLWWKELPPLLADIALHLAFSAQVDRSVSHFCVA